MEKLKRQTRKVGVAGGFINQMMGNNSTEPKVGEGATILHYSDRTPYEVISVSEDGLSCVIRELKATHIGESYGDERYTYESNPNGRVYNLEWNKKKNKWCTVFTEVLIIKALENRLRKEHGWKYMDYLPLPEGVTMKDLRDEDSINFSFNLIEGVTKEYKTYHPISIIFGVAEKYYDPHF